MLEHVTHEITVEALPTDIPESIAVDVSGMDIGDTMQLDSVIAPEGVEFALGEGVEAEEVTIATLNPPRVEEEPEPEVEEEAELIGEDGEPIEAPEGEEAEGEARRGRRRRRRRRRLRRLRRGVGPPCPSSAGGDATPATGAKPATGSWSSASATPARSTRRPATTSASRSSPS